jgi:hypothetical protein
MSDYHLAKGAEIFDPGEYRAARPIAATINRCNNYQLPNETCILESRNCGQ